MNRSHALALKITEQVSIESAVNSLADALRALHDASDAYVGAAVPRFSLGKSSPERGRYVLVNGSMARPIQIIEPARVDHSVAEDALFLVQLTERWVDALTQVEHLSQSLQEASSRDTLTGVLNRRSFLSAAARRLEAAQAEGRILALILLDVREFSEINSSLGYELGDELLFEVASKVRVQLREHDLVARLEGDQFIVLLDQIPSAESVERVAQRILSCLDAMPVESWKGVRLGAAVTPGAGSSVLALIDAASEALSQAKTAGEPTAYRL
ncbi:MAG: hypothetical protein RLY30_891 [Pseudomonadota bacterium]|jgi:diguanylate cyclase (GGDEF)-like protein